MPYIKSIDGSNLAYSGNWCIKNASPIPTSSVEFSQPHPSGSLKFDDRWNDVDYYNAPQEQTTILDTAYQWWNGGTNVYNDIEGTIVPGDFDRIKNWGSAVDGVTLTEDSINAPSYELSGPGVRFTGANTISYDGSFSGSSGAIFVVFKIPYISFGIQNIFHAYDSTTTGLFELSLEHVDGANDRLSVTFNDGAIQFGGYQASDVSWDIDSKMLLTLSNNGDGDIYSCRLNGEEITGLPSTWGNALWFDDMIGMDSFTMGASTGYTYLVANMYDFLIFNDITNEQMLEIETFLNQTHEIY